MKKSKKYDYGGVVFAGGTPNFDESMPQASMQSPMNQLQQIKSDRMARQDAKIAAREAMLADKMASRNTVRPQINVPSQVMSRRPMANRNLPATNVSNAPAIAPMKKGGLVKSASKRADGIAQRGKTRGKMV